LAIKAAQNLIEKANLDPKEIDLVIMATATPDMPVAATGVYVATQIGATNAFAYDLHAACSSFLYGMSTASAYIASGKYKKVLLIGADKMSSIIDYTDRATCIIFGDGGGAVLFEPNTEGLGLQDEFLRSDGIGREFLKIDAGGSILPASQQTIDDIVNSLNVDETTKTLIQTSLTEIGNEVKTFAEVLQSVLTNMGNLGTSAIDNWISGGQGTNQGTQPQSQDFILRPGQDPINFRADDLLIGGTKLIDALNLQISDIMTPNNNNDIVIGIDKITSSFEKMASVKKQDTTNNVNGDVNLLVNGKIDLTIDGKNLPQNISSEELANEIVNNPDFKSKIKNIFTNAKNTYPD
jgi:hypothetical protein